MTLVTPPEPRGQTFKGFDHRNLGFFAHEVAVVVVVAAAAAVVVDDAHLQLLVLVALQVAACATHLVGVSFSYVWHFLVLTCPCDEFAGGHPFHHLAVVVLVLDFRCHHQHC